MNFEARHKAYQDACDADLRRVVSGFFQPGSVVSEAAGYTLLNGGKHVRGVLVQAVCDLLGGRPAGALPFASALEMVHTFSLMHDDLPCMDDDDMRRGKPAAHIVYGDAIALLAGDLLALEAFRVAATSGMPANMAGRACAVLAAAAGAKGMIYGQELDLRYEEETADQRALEQVQEYKTGALFLASAQLGVLAAGEKPEQTPIVTRFAGLLGRVFQIIDDILDVTSTTDMLGKPVGSDRTQGKSTFVTVLGLEGARREAARLTGEAIQALRSAYGDDAWFLAEYADQLLGRIV